MAFRIGIGTPCALAAAGAERRPWAWALAGGARRAHIVTVIERSSTRDSTLERWRWRRNTVSPCSIYIPLSFKHGVSIMISYHIRNASLYSL